MNTVNNIIEIGIWTSVLFSLFFVSARIYAAYLRKEDDGCSEDCSCKVSTPVNPQITDSVTVEKPKAKAKIKPKRKEVKKKVTAIKDDKLVITKVKESPEKKKRTRKKSSQ